MVRGNIYSILSLPFQQVETVGDCYGQWHILDLVPFQNLWQFCSHVDFLPSLTSVAATGCPEPRDDHALIMAKFARACMRKMRIVTQKLELTLGPDTGNLTLRVGLHSGQVTGGVLRGERARFQLFGDTVNTASRVSKSLPKNI